MGSSAITADGYRDRAGFGPQSISAYRKVFLLAPVSRRLGLMHARTVVLHLRLSSGSNTCLRTLVNMLCRNGMYGFFDDFVESASAIPRIQSFSTERLILISRVSFILSLECEARSRAASEPAKSMRYRTPSPAVSDDGSSILMRQIPCEREEPSFLVVGAVCRSLLASSVKASRSSLFRTLCSRIPTS